MLFIHISWQIFFYLIGPPFVSVLYNCNLLSQYYDDFLTRPTSCVEE